MPQRASPLTVDIAHSGVSFIMVSTRLSARLEKRDSYAEGAMGRCLALSMPGFRRCSNRSIKVSREGLAFSLYAPLARAST